MRVANSCLAGHPNKLCDQIADAVVDTFLREDPHTRLSLHVLGSPGMMLIAGKVRTRADFDCATIATHIYREVGYTDELDVFVNLEFLRDHTHQQQLWQTQPVQVIGFACRESKDLLPRPIVLAHSLARHIDHLRMTDPSMKWLLPDGSVSVLFKEDRPDLISLHVTHHADIHVQDVRSLLFDRLLKGFEGSSVALSVNPEGPRSVAGFGVRSGMSGAETHSDLYHHLLPCTTPGLSGKDPFHPERAGTYFARAVARTLLDDEDLTSVLVEALYVPGKALPERLRAQAMTKEGKTVGVQEALRALNLDWRTEAIVERFDLLRPLYRSSAVYGHVGRAQLPWEQSLRETPKNVLH